MKFLNKLKSYIYDNTELLFACGLLGCALFIILYIVYLLDTIGSVFLILMLFYTSSWVYFNNGSKKTSAIALLLAVGVIIYELIRR